jgi:hypothetical protein
MSLFSTIRKRGLSQTNPSLIAFLSHKYVTSPFQKMAAADQDRADSFVTYVGINDPEPSTCPQDFVECKHCVYGRKTVEDTNGGLGNPIVVFTSREALAAHIIECHMSRIKVRRYIDK